MAYSAAMRCSSPLWNLPSNSSTSLPLNRSSPLSVSFRSNFRRSSRLSIKSSSGSVSATPVEGLAPAISLTENALKHLKRIRSERGEDLCLRVGVQQGGCSGMSYTMDFESKENAGPEDSVTEHNGFTIVCDSKSLLSLYGMQLDYSDELIGGGFNFKNPNATKTCSCGKSFATPDVKSKDSVKCSSMFASSLGLSNEHGNNVMSTTMHSFGYFDLHGNYVICSSQN